MKRLLSIALSATLLAACGSSSDTTNTNPPSLTTAAEINTYLVGKSWKMTGADIPSHPNGFNEDMNLAAATQCYNETVIATDANWAVTSKLGTLTGAPNLYDVGTCDHATVNGAPLTFTSTTILVENVEGNGACFDVTATYVGFTQAGRGKFSADGKTMTLELFFAGQATGADCASGDVGSGGITLNAAAFTGNAQQVYRLQ